MKKLRKLNIQYSNSNHSELTAETIFDPEGSFSFDCVYCSNGIEIFPSIIENNELIDSNNNISNKLLKYSLSVLANNGKIYSIPFGAKNSNTNKILVIAKF